MCKLDQAMQLLNEWIEENRPRIRNAVMAAFLRLDGVAEAMTDSDAGGAERVRQRTIGLIVAAESVLPSFIGDEFEREFSEVTEPLASALKQAAVQIAEDERSELINQLIQRHGQ